MKVSIKSLIIILAFTLIFAGCLFNNNTTNENEPTLGEGTQSECHDLTKLNEEEWVEFLIDGHSVTINHYDAYRNCGMEVDFQMEFDMPIIIVREYDVGMPADCMCYLDFSVILSEMEPGNYNIELWAGDDYMIAEEDVTIE
jgi:hypothetical protein